MSEPLSIQEAIESYAETNHPALLAVRDEIVSLINGDTNTIFQVAKAGLEQMYTNAVAHGDRAGAFLAENVFEHVLELYQANDQLLGMTVASTAAMQKAVAERDELVEAIEEQDTDHPLVGQLVEDVSEQVAYEWQMGYDDATREEALEACTQNAMEFLSLGDETAYRLARLLVLGYTGYGDSALSAGLLLEIGDFIERKLRGDD